MNESGTKLVLSTRIIRWIGRAVRLLWVNRASYQTGLLLIVWLVWMQLGVFFSINNFDFQPTYPYAYELLPDYGQRWLTTWAGFDGVHYLTIVEEGYRETELIQAFFPVYPLLVKALSINGQINPLVVGVFVSMTATMVGLYYLNKLLELDQDSDSRRKAFWLMLVFPVSFFFIAMYTEGLFFMLIVLTFYLARTRHWFWAGLLGAVAAGTKLIGVLLVPALIYEWWTQSRAKDKNGVGIKELVWAIWPVLGLAAYMVYLKITFDNPLLFYAVQDDFGASREAGRIILLPQVIWRYIKMLATVEMQSWLFYRVLLEFGAGVWGLIMACLSFRYVRRSYALFGLLAYLLPTLTGTFSSMPRYLLPLFPLFVVMAKIVPKKWYPAVVVFSSIMLVVNLLIFTQGVFVS